MLAADWDMVLEWVDGVHSGPVDPKSLPISPELRMKLGKWYSQFSELFLSDDARSHPSDDLDWWLFDEAGVEIWQQLLLELQGAYEVVYSSWHFGLLERPEEWEEWFKVRRSRKA